jgi:LuxR family glucitol operon transcriptional activator
LDKLYLFQRAWAETGNARQAANTLILDTLKVMEEDQGQSARLLRLRFLDQMTMTAVANRLNIAEGTAYKLQKQAISGLATLLYQLEHQARLERQTRLERRLNLPPHTQLIGIEERLTHLLNLVARPGPAWLISIEGLGGIGKTALANALVRELVLTSHIQEIAWVSAKQQEFHPAFGVQANNQTALNTDTLVNSLLEQLHPEPPLTTSPEEKLATLNTLLKKSPYFIVIDNLETVTDYQTLLPTLRKLANPSRFLITSRHSLQAYSDVYCFSLKALSQADTIAFLKYEAEARRISTLAAASQAQLESIYQVVGGNPLALKLVAGQIRILPLAQVLDNLKQARGKKIEALYTYIYWQAWHALDAVSQQVLLLMPLAQDGDLAQLAAVSKLDVDQLNEALEHLVSLSLVEVSGGLEELHYRIHRLTESFLLTEVTKWQSGT